MKNKGVFVFGIISLVIFMGISAYLWYLYFHNYEGRIIAENKEFAFMRGVEFVNSGSIDYVNAKATDDDSVIPTYYFRVKNNYNEDFEYELIISEATVKDGCNSDTNFKRSDLDYTLKFDNKVLREGSLDTITNDVLDSNVIKAKSINDYSLKIKLKPEVTEYENKHYHFVVTLKEKK